MFPTVSFFRLSFVSSLSFRFRSIRLVCFSEREKEGKGKESGGESERGKKEEGEKKIRTKSQRVPNAGIPASLHPSMISEFPM